ncbi:MAG: hypothetical protein FJZ97_02685 [Chloroflexi bacterium]|nr:hypothetical protein [Chloroflexota bacterium]
MFDSQAVQIANLEEAYRAFCETLLALAPNVYLASLGDWTPRDIAAHVVGWNRITLVGSAQLREGVWPIYFDDGTNDYRQVNAGFCARFTASDRGEMLAQKDSTMGELMSYLRLVPEGEWELDTGVIHYRPGPATVARRVDSLIRDDRKHREEILARPKPVV